MAQFEKREKEREAKPSEINEFKAALLYKLEDLGFFKFQVKETKVVSYEMPSSSSEQREFLNGIETAFKSREKAIEEKMKDQTAEFELDALKSKNELLQKHLDESNQMCEQLSKSVKDLEAQRTALAIDLNQLEEEVTVTRKQAQEKFKCEQEKEEVQNQLKEEKEKTKALTEKVQEMKDKAR